MTAKELQTLRVIAAGKSKAKRKKPRSAAQKAATAKMLRANKAAKRKKTRAGTKAKKSKAPRRKAGGATKKRAAKQRPTRKRATSPRPGASKLSGQEREGMALVADLINAQFAASGKLKDAAPFVKQLSDAQRRALIAADRRVRKAAGR